MEQFGDFDEIYSRIESAMNMSGHAMDDADDEIQNEIDGKKIL